MVISPNIHLKMVTQIWSMVWWRFESLNLLTFGAWWSVAAWNLMASHLFRNLDFLLAFIFSELFFHARRDQKNLDSLLIGVRTFAKKRIKFGGEETWFQLLTPTPRWHSDDASSPAFTHPDSQIPIFFAEYELRWVNWCPNIDGIWPKPSPAWASSCRCDAKLPGRLGGCAQEIHLKNILDYCTYVCKSDTKQYILGVFGRWKHTFLYEFFFGKHSELLQYTMETPDAAFKTQINECRIFWELDFQNSCDRTCHWIHTFLCQKVGFSTMSAIALAPLTCYTHPNQQQSLLKYPNVCLGHPSSALFCRHAFGNLHRWNYLFNTRKDIDKRVIYLLDWLVNWYPQMFFSIVNDKQLTPPWNPKQPVFNGCLVISNHLPTKDLEWLNHPIENHWTTGCLGYQVQLRISQSGLVRQQGKKDAQECSMSVYRMKYGIIMIMVWSFFLAGGWNSLWNGPGFRGWDDLGWFFHSSF